MESLLDGRGNILGALNQETVLHHRPGDTDHIGLLEGVIADQVGLHLARQYHHGNGIHVGRGDAGDGIGGTRTRGYQHHARLAGGAGVAVGRVGGRLLMAHQDVRDLRVLEECVIYMQHRATRVTEDKLDTLVLQCAGDHFAAG